MKIDIEVSDNEVVALIALITLILGGALLFFSMWKWW